MSQASATMSRAANPLNAFGWPLLILFVGLGLRLACVLEFAAHPIGRLPWVDEGAYWTRALEIADGAWLPDRPFYQDPLFPYILAGLARVFGTEVATLRVALACTGALTPVVVFIAGRRGIGTAEGVVAGLLCAACGPLAFADCLLEKEGLAALVAATALALTAVAADPAAKARWAAASGLAWGLMTLFRANTLALAPVGALYWVLTDRLRVSAPQRRVRAGVFLAGFLLAIAPVSIANAYISKPHELILTTWQGGANFYIGNGPEATGTYAAPNFVEANPAREADDFAAEAARRAGHPLTCSAVSRFWLNEGLKRWRDAPAASLRLLAHKLGLVLHDFEIPDNHDLEFVRLVAAPALSWGVVSVGLLLPLAAIGLVRSGRTPFLSFLGLSTAMGLATTAAFFVVGRYRIPWFPGLALLAAAGMVDLYRRFTTGRWLSAVGLILLLAVPAAAIAWRPMADPTPNRFGHAQIELALAYLAEGSLDPAIDALDDARAIGEGPARRIEELLANPSVHNRLASLIDSRLSLAARGPDVGRLVHARWLRQLPETRGESRALLESLLRSQPGDRRVLKEWGAWQLGDSANRDARRLGQEALERAAALPGGDPSAAILLALVSSDRRHLEPIGGRSDDARTAMRARLADSIIQSRKGVGIAGY